MKKRTEYFSQYINCPKKESKEIVGRLLDELSKMDRDLADVKRWYPYDDEYLKPFGSNDKIMISFFVNRYKHVFLSYNGIGCKPMSFNEIGKQVLLSGSRVGQIYSKAVLMMSHPRRKKFVLTGIRDPKPFDTPFENLFKSIDQINWCSRTKNGLKQIGIKIVGQVILMNRKEIVEKSKFKSPRGIDKWIGPQTLRNLEYTLKELGLEIGMNLPEYVVERIKNYETPSYWSPNNLNPVVVSHDCLKAVGLILRKIEDICLEPQFVFDCPRDKLDPFLVSSSIYKEINTLRSLLGIGYEVKVLKTTK